MKGQTVGIMLGLTGMLPVGLCCAQAQDFPPILTPFPPLLSDSDIAAIEAREARGIYISSSLGGVSTFVGPQQRPYRFDLIKKPTIEDELNLLFPDQTNDVVDPDHSEFGNFTNLAAGFRFSSKFRVEAEVSYLQDDVAAYRAFSVASKDPSKKDKDKEDSPYFTPPGGDLDTIYSTGYGKVETKATFANGFYDLPIDGSRWLPYVGAGVGVAEVDVDYRPGGIDVVNNDEVVFAYQAIVGMSYAFKSDTDLVLGARYRGMSDVDMQSEYLPPAFAVENEGLIGEVGIRLGF